MSGLLASDLDRTLIFPWKTLPEPRNEELIAEIYEERPITVCSPKTLKGIERLVAKHAFVAVTTRSREQLERIEPVWERIRGGWAICANGATLLNAGRVDREWKDLVDVVSRAAASLPEAERALTAAFGAPGEEHWLLRVRACDNRFLYAILDPERMPETLAADAEQAMAAIGWTAVLHGRKLYVLPVGLTKVACVEFLCERLGVQHLMAAGDSLLDAPLLAAADVAWAPADSELVTWGAVPPGVRVTAGSHMAAGEEIVEAALEELKLVATR